MGKGLDIAFGVLGIIAGLLLIATSIINIVEAYRSTTSFGGLMGIGVIFGYLFSLALIMTFTIFSFKGKIWAKIFVVILFLMNLFSFLIIINGGLRM